MISKKLINKYLYLLNKHCRYNNISYGVNNYNDYITISIYIWDDLAIIRNFGETIYNDECFNELENKIINFIKENKEIIGEKI